MNNDKTKSGRGGRREGAGRPTSVDTPEWTTVRITKHAKALAEAQASAAGFASVAAYVTHLIEAQGPQ